MNERLVHAVKKASLTKSGSATLFVVVAGGVKVVSAPVKDLVGEEDIVTDVWLDEFGLVLDLVETESEVSRLSVTTYRPTDGDL